MKKILILITLLIIFVGCDDNPASTVNVPPTVSFVIKADTILMEPAGKCDIEALAADKDGSIMKVILYMDGYIYSEKTSSPYIFTLNDVARGYHLIKMKAIDNSYVETLSPNKVLYVPSKDSINFYLNCKPYYYQITFMEGDTLLMSMSSFNINPEQIERVSFYMDDNILFEDQTYPYSYKIDSLPPGNHKFYLKLEFKTGRYFYSNIVNYQVLKYEAPKLNLSIVTYTENNFLPDQKFYYNFETTVIGGWIDFINVYLNDSQTAHLINYDKTDRWTSWSEYFLTGLKTGKYKLKLEAVSNNGLSSTAEVEFNVVNGFYLPEDVYKLVIADSPTTLFALCRYGRKIYKIDLEQQIIIREYSLTVNNANNFKYSQKNNIIYVNYYDSPVITAINCQNGSVRTYTAPSVCNDIELDDENDRLFAACSTGVIVLNTLNINNELFRLQDKNIRSVVYDRINKLLYLKYVKYFYEEYILKYRVNSNGLNLIDSSSKFSSQSNFILKPGNSTILYNDDGNSATSGSWMELDVNNNFDIIRTLKLTGFGGFSYSGQYSFFSTNDHGSTNNYVYLNSTDYYTNIKKLWVYQGSGAMANTSDDSYFATYYSDRKFLFIFRLK
ncbi:MAG: hypothetical protein EPN82_14440 [Bacteroidetes bacterium]|nr:MAG: hypothetical protein EPN82_14440 [Bacteroidota bacterium]